MPSFLSPLSEHKKYNISLYQTNLFLHQNTHQFSSMLRIVVSFRFRSIEFNKKRSLLFFLSLELLTGRKPVASLSSRNIQAWKIRKGRLVGCKITLREKNLHDFLDTCILSLPQREKLQPFRFTNKASHLNRKSISSFSFRFSELVLFYPIEAGIGLHSDFQYLYRTCAFSTFSHEARIFCLQSFHLPVEIKS